MQYNTIIKRAFIYLTWYQARVSSSCTYRRPPSPICKICFLSLSIDRKSIVLALLFPALVHLALFPSLMHLTATFCSNRSVMTDSRFSATYYHCPRLQSNVTKWCLMSCINTPSTLISDNLKTDFILFYCFVHIVLDMFSHQCLQLIQLQSQWWWF